MLPESNGILPAWEHFQSGSTGSRLGLTRGHLPPKGTPKTICFSLPSGDCFTASQTQAQPQSIPRLVMFQRLDRVVLVGMACHANHSTCRLSRVQSGGTAPRRNLFMKTSKSEEVYRNEYRDFHDAHASVGEFLERVYNQRRLHSQFARALREPPLGSKLRFHRTMPRGL